MTWGIDCPKCGRKTCSWSYRNTCEGIYYPDEVLARDERAQLPWYKRLFVRSIPVTVHSFVTQKGL